VAGKNIPLCVVRWPTAFPYTNQNRRDRQNAAVQYYLSPWTRWRLW
jgi:hypothetical protein